MMTTEQLKHYFDAADAEMARRYPRRKAFNPQWIREHTKLMREMMKADGVA